jgi:hypothetical protein
MARQKFRDVIRFVYGFILARPKLDRAKDYAATGSVNVVFTGQGKATPFKGLELVSGVGGTQSGAVSDGVGALTDVAP